LAKPKHRKPRHHRKPVPAPVKPAVFLETAVDVKATTWAQLEAEAETEAQTDAEAERVVVIASNHYGLLTHFSRFSAHC